MRYFRCINPDCRRKWHHISIAHIAQTRMEVRTDLLDQPLEPGKHLCPTCHADLKPERGTFDDLFPDRAEFAVITDLMRGEST